MPIPILLTIGGLQLYTIVLFLLPLIIIYIAVFWSYSRKDLKNNSIFDITFLTLLTAFLSSRALGVLVKITSYLERGWSFFPVTESGDQILLFNELPWSFFNFSDGNFEYIGVFLGLVIGLLIIYQNSNQKKSVYTLFDRVILSYSVASIALVVGMFISGIDMGTVTTGGLSVTYADGVTRFPLQLLQLAFVFIAVVLYAVFQFVGIKRQGLFASLFMVGFGVVEFLLRSNVAGYSAEILGFIDFHQLLALTIVLVGIVLIISSINLRLVRSKPLSQQIPPRKPKPLQERQKGTSAENRFIISFTDRLKSQNQDKSKS